MTACAERRPEGPGRPNSAPEVGQGWPITPRARRGTLPFWLVVSSVPHYKSSSLYALSLYGTNHCFLLPIPSSFPCQASCVDSKTGLVLAGHAMPRSVLSSWNNFFGDFKIQLLMRDIHPSTKNVEPWLPERSWVMTDDVSFGWGYTSCSQVLSCKQFGDFFLDRWEMFVLHPSTKTPTAVKHFWILLIDDWSCFVWMSFFKLQPGLQL